MNISDKVAAVNSLVISMKYPMERLTHHNEATVTVDGLSTCLSDNVIESYCNAGLEQAEAEIVLIEMAIASYRVGQHEH